MKSLQIRQTTFELFHGDITTLKVDVVVNSANSALAGGSGVDGAIHRAAGRVLEDECRKIIAARGELAPGQAVSTIAGAMDAKFIVHAVGPIYQDGAHGEAQILASAYLSSLIEAEKLGAQSIAFPGISTVVYRYPEDEAAEIAAITVSDYIKETPGTKLTKVIFALFTRGVFGRYERLFDLLGMIDPADE
jgi:O-acetyl-ADP-ribose deacetylase (regulator of RNase III)